MLLRELLQSSAEEAVMLDLSKLLRDVFDPQPGEVCTVMVDLPREGIEDTDSWRERRDMAARWREALHDLGAERGFEVRSLLTFPSTGGNNADLPPHGWIDGAEVDLIEALASSTLVIAMTQYSATAPLAVLADAHGDFRAASMPGVQPRMEATALAADYAKVAARCANVMRLLEGAVLCDVLFSTGHRCWFDLRDRTPEMDDGSLPRGKEGDRIINLPSGETFVVPYEGERQEQPSWTAGTIPVSEDGELVLFHITGNRIELVEGDGPAAERYAEHFGEDPARANIAEVAFGVNDQAVVCGSVIEDEKAGFHWAFGRSDHLGGTVGVDAFAGPETVVHQDIVYASGNPIQVVRAVLRTADGDERVVIAEGSYTEAVLAST
jgi:hypothetical protein